MTTAHFTLPTEAPERLIPLRDMGAELARLTSELESAQADLAHERKHRHDLVARMNEDHNKRIADLKLSATSDVAAYRDTLLSIWDAITGRAPADAIESIREDIIECATATDGGDPRLTRSCDTCDGSGTVGDVDLVHCGGPTNAYYESPVECECDGCDGRGWVIR